MTFDVLAGMIESVSEALVFAEKTDYQALLSLHKDFIAIGNSASDNGFDRIKSLSFEAGRLLECLILDTVADSDGMVGEINNTVSQMQLLLREAVSTRDTNQDKQFELEDFEVAEEVNNVDQSEETETTPLPSITLPKNADMQILGDFLSRQDMILEELEGYILEYEKDEALHSVDAIKRIIHTMKGDAGLLGLEEVQELCHITEALLEDGSLNNLGDVLLEIKDWLSRTFRALSGKGQPPGPASILLELLLGVDSPYLSSKQNLPDLTTDGTQVVDETDEFFLTDELDLLNDFINESIEHLDNVEIQMLTLETNPEDSMALNAVFRAFHTIKGVAGYLTLDQIGNLSHNVESLLDKGRKGEILLQGLAVDIIFDSVDLMKTMITNIRNAMKNGTPVHNDKAVDLLIERIIVFMKDGGFSKDKPVVASESGKKIGEILIKKGLVSKTVVDKALEEQQQEFGSERLGEILIKEKSITAKEISQALRSQKSEVGDAGVVHIRESIKVDAERLDKMIDMIGELVITESMVSKIIRDHNDSIELMAPLGLLDKITRQLQETSTSLRLVPVRNIFQKMARLVRDLSRKSSKNVEFIMNGEDTEVDKSIVDKIGDPLVHIIRNAVDHGVEGDEAERTENGKPPVARIELRAFHKGGNIYIEIQDDGKGLDKDKILAKARENNLIAEGTVLSDKEIYGLIFTPGFSTAKEVTDVSGRGIGMDVVRRNVDALRGSIDVRSEIGKGSIFSIRLPLTLAIIDGMKVRVGGEDYIIPTLSIIRSLRPDEHALSSLQKKGQMFDLDGQVIPLFFLGNLFDIDDAKEDLSNAIIVVVESDGMYTGLVVDELIGQQQIVIKTLGKYLQNIPGISGSTIMTDGNVALILDVAGLVKLANK